LVEKLEKFCSPLVGVPPTGMQHLGEVFSETPTATVKSAP